ncbi:hypothetical protein [Spirosoma foliorum]|uniref:Uncharacterized protein n=1 Tax=Spirosoma foliorum TaxID=2710596 RepID=A0A7G5H187_9BACT|nr:hypothetical protein [Spirosoma foliorum]QMW04879.1 hypothetical protein H3H32_08205 [Spirosoma foliorum]
MREVNDRWVRVVWVGLLWLRDSYTNKIFILTPNLVTVKHAIELLILTTLTWESTRCIAGVLLQ